MVKHLSLVGASIVVTSPAVGLLLTLIAFGAAADRYGERIVIASGVGASTVFLVGASLVHGAVWLSIMLGLAGAGAGSVNAASGRMILGWFSLTERGLALTCDGNHRWCALDPRQGTALVVAEAVLNLACVGARPLGLVNCLNFGNPEHPEVMWPLSA